jgi:hypothetical protein
MKIVRAEATRRTIRVFGYTFMTEILQGRSGNILEIPFWQPGHLWTLQRSAERDCHYSKVPQGRTPFITKLFQIYESFMTKVEVWRDSG